LTVVDVVVSPVSLALLHADVCVSTVVVVHGVPCALSFGAAGSVVTEHVFTLSATAVPDGSATARAATVAPTSTFKRRRIKNAPFRVRPSPLGAPIRATAECST